ncbi:hypothetical protein HRbin32_00653 [bacterium HR32]|nr:hypothetical protein HRbin32_00653 [bacterium HR32]
MRSLGKGNGAGEENSPSVALSTRERRRKFLEMALRRARPGAGTAVEVLRRRTALRRWPDLSPLLAGIPWAVVGAVGARAYMPERATADLDVVVTPQDAPEVYRRLREAGFTEGPALLGGGRSYTTPDGVPVDVLTPDAPWLPEALAHVRRDPQGLPVLPLPYLVLMKVQAGRTQDLADAARMLGAAPEEEREGARELFRRWLPDALEDLESLIRLGELELGAEPQ